MNKNKMKILFSIFAVIVGLFTLVQAPFLIPFAFGAVLTSGILGPGSGKVGGAVMSKWKSIDYIRAYVVPSNPKSDDQVAQRVRFKAMILLAQKFMAIVIPQCWDPFYDKMSGFNAFVKENFPLLDNSNLITTAFVTTKGTLEEAPIDSVTYNSVTGALVVDWATDVFGNGLATDSLIFSVVDKSDNAVVFSGLLSAVTRSTGTKTVTGKLGRTATNLICALSTFRGVGVDYMQSNNSNVIATAA